MIILLSWPTLHAQRGLHGHGRAISLTTMFDEHYPMLCDMARGANERVVLNATESNTLVWDHLRQGQLSATGCTTHRSNSRTRTSTHPYSSIGHWPAVGCGTALLCRGVAQ